MIISQISKKTYFFLLLLVVLVIYSAVGIDYSSLETFSLAMGKEVLQGLAHPDWHYLYDGSGEDLISLLLLTLGIAFLGTFIATILALPVTCGKIILGLLKLANLFVTFYEHFRN